MLEQTCFVPAQLLDLLLALLCSLLVLDPETALFVLSYLAVALNPVNKLNRAACRVTDGQCPRIHVARCCLVEMGSAPPSL